MHHTIGQRIHRYLLDGSDEDLKRLLAISELMSSSTRTALRRSGIQAGWAVIDCGCGPLGGLLDLAEMTGPAGRVVGVDASQAAARRARSAVATLGLGNVEIVAGDCPCPPLPRAWRSSGWTGPSSSTIRIGDSRFTPFFLDLTLRKPGGGNGETREGRRNGSRRPAGRQDTGGWVARCGT
jgi:SAM-dependent methyltransferase